jgi:uncharacterized membrane protein YkvA (DUF1232 family)
MEDSKEKGPAPDQPTEEDIHEDLKCPICLSLFRGATETSCGHSFCGRCLLDYLKRQNDCPICRAPIISAHPSWSLRRLVENARRRNGETIDETEERDQRDLDTQLPQSTPQGFIASIREDFRTLKELLSGNGGRRYWQAWIAITVCLIYVILPLDFIPDWTSALAFVDDLFIILWLVLFLRNVVREWRREQ